MDDTDLHRALGEGARAGQLPIGVLNAGLHEGIVELMSPSGFILGMVRGPETRFGVIMVGGAIGGFGGPGGVVYHRLAERLESHGIASFRMHGREPDTLESCVQDVLTTRQWWSAHGVERVAIIGHSMGGATAIAATAFDKQMAGAACLAPQTAGTDMVPQIAPRPLLLIHGTDDMIVPAFCTDNIAERAGEPCEVVKLEGVGHVMGEAADELVARLEKWAPFVLGV